MTSDIIKEPTAIEDTIEVTSEQVLAGHKEWRTEDHREPCYVPYRRQKSLKWWDAQNAPTIRQSDKKNTNTMRKCH